MWTERHLKACLTTNETRYGQKDRRPLDPPPVLQLRFYRVFNNGTAHQWEHEIDAYTYAVQLLTPQTGSKTEM